MEDLIKRDQPNPACFELNPSHEQRLPASTHGEIFWDFPSSFERENAAEPHLTCYLAALILLAWLIPNTAGAESFLFHHTHTGGELDAAALAYHILLESGDYKDFARVHESQFTDPGAFSAMAAEYNTWIDAALKNAVQRADTIIGTSYAAYKLANQGIWSADVVIHDEAARATEPETLTAWACFPHAYVRVTAGDPKQSPAIFLSIDAHRSNDLAKRFINPFAHQAKLPFMERVELAGVFTTYLHENHRTLHGLADYCSDEFYDGGMHQSKPAGATPDEQRAIDWLRSYAPTMRGARLWLDVEGMTETKT
ncbi:hypothetical protein DL765_004434 [Monosporascus sp. GIB2]|nr:hypothetical protein DL765_004434 [Monosporascus sp. GIB2]